MTDAETVDLIRLALAAPREFGIATPAEEAFEAMLDHLANPRADSAQAHTRFLVSVPGLADRYPRVAALLVQRGGQLPGGG
jgi:hypothetical protein